MSIEINISRVNGKVVFSDPNSSQSDLVFWHNGDTEAHWPVPGCTGLQVAPGATSVPYQFLPPNPTFPLSIVYGCAVPGHESEQGTLTVNQDVPPPAPVGPGGTPSTRTIVIGKGGVFPDIDVAQIESVAWKNDDTTTHYPVPNCTGLNVKAGGVSNDMHPSPPPGAPTVPLTVEYGCAIPGHEKERGTINLYGTLVAPPPPAAPPIPTPPPPVAVSPVKPYAAAPIAVGGKSPYKMTDDPAYPFLTLVETAPAGSSAGISLVLKSDPTNLGPFNYNLDVTDAMGTRLTQAVSVSIAYTMAAVPTATIFSKVKPFAPVAVVTGGKSPYKLTPDPAHPYLSLVETAPAGSSAGVSAVLNTDPPASGPITYQLNVTDATQATLNQAITIILI